MQRAKVTCGLDLGRGVGGRSRVCQVGGDSGEVMGCAAMAEGW